MPYGRAVLVTRILGLVLAGVYTIAAIVVVYAGWSVGRTAVGLVLLGGGAVLILIGQRLTLRWPRLAPALACVGAALGGLALLALILPPLAAAVFIAMTISLARQQPTPA
jgi:hypothetical protein